MSDQRGGSTVDLAANLTIAWLTNPNVRANTDDATAFLQNIHSTLTQLSAASGNDGPSALDPAPAEDESDHVPAVTVRKSLASREHIISMIDGKPYRSLKRHLSSRGLTPDQYRERYGLKKDYPMVAPAYSEQRRAVAQKIGLGRKAGTKAPRTRRASKPKS